MFINSPSTRSIGIGIDITQWKLSSYWNKQMGDHWRVSAMVTKLKDNEVDNVAELLKGFKPKKFKPVKRIKTPGKVKTAGVLSLQDIHFGKEGNETIDKCFEETIKDLIQRASNSHHLEKLYYDEYYVIFSRWSSVVYRLCGQNI